MYPVSRPGCNVDERVILTVVTTDFDTEFTKEKPTLTPVQQQLSAADQAEFAGFSWVSPHNVFCRTRTEEICFTDCTLGELDETEN
jgi:hypothetical protein